MTARRRSAESEPGTSEAERPHAAEMLQLGRCEEIVGVTARRTGPRTEAECIWPDDANIIRLDGCELRNKST